MTTPAVKRRPGRRVLWFALQGVVAILALALILAGGAAYIFYDQVQRVSEPGEIVRVEIPPGISGYAVGTLLTQQGLIRDPVFFRLAIRMSGHDPIIKAGKYDLPQGVSANQLLQLLEAGPNVPFSADDVPPDQVVTIPEGLSIAQMAQQFDDPAAFMEAASSPELLQRLGIEGANAEGFLMPNTYYFDAPPAPDQVVTRMATQFMREWDALSSEFVIPEGRTLRELVTIASLVEKEARVDEERPLVAAVIYNRLKQRMTLDFDSTLQYALHKYGQRMLNSDKEVNSPYNTYRNAGLPPGPIANPGVQSLRAALQPADVEYLYFVSNADGKTHTFSRTLEEHNRAVARYRRDISEQRRQLRDTQTPNGLSSQ